MKFSEKTAPKFKKKMTKLCSMTMAQDLYLLKNSKQCILHKKCRLVQKIQMQIQSQKLCFQNTDINIKGTGCQYNPKLWIILVIICFCVMAFWITWLTHRCNQFGGKKCIFPYDLYALTRKTDEWFIF